MNKGFAYYFKQAFKMAAQTVWKNKNLLKGMLYFFTTLVARLTVVLGAMVSLADVRQAKIAKNQRTIDIPQSLTKASQRPLWTMIVAVVLEALIYLGGFLMVSVVCGGIFALGLGIAQLLSGGNIILIIFAVPCLIIYAVYSIIVITIFAPTSYVIDSNPELSAGDVISVCVSSMKNRGKLTVFMCIFIPSIVIGAVFAIIAGGYTVIALLLSGESYMMLLLVLWTVVAVVLLGFLVPVFTVTKNLSLVLLFEDIALDPVNARKRTAGINIKKISGARVDREEIADNLSALFDDGIEEKVPDPEDLVHKHKKKKKVVKNSDQPAPQPVASTAQTPVDDTEIEEVDDYANEAPTREEIAAARTAAQQPSQPTAEAPQPVRQAAPQQPVPPNGQSAPQPNPAAQQQMPPRPNPMGQQSAGQAGQPVRPVGQAPMGQQPAGQPMGQRPVPPNGQPAPQPSPAAQQQMPPRSNPMGQQPMGQAGQPVRPMGQAPMGQQPAGQPMGQRPVPPNGQPAPQPNPAAQQQMPPRPNPAAQPRPAQPNPMRQPPQGGTPNGGGNV